MRLIPLTQGKFAKVDDADYPRLATWSWFARQGESGIWYAARTEREGDYQGQVSMHREILGVSEDVAVDHKDGDGLNNQRENLREATKTQNGQNRGKNRNSKSRYKGVSWATRESKWFAQIQIDGKKKWLGYCETELEVAQLYDSYASTKFGAFARLNFPLDKGPAVTESDFTT
jgi:hypothetical protein